MHVAHYPPHSACCSSTNAFDSSSVQASSTQVVAVDRKAWLLHRQVTSVLEKKERMREGDPMGLGK